MADNVTITAGSGTTVHADEYTHGTLGSGKTQLVKLTDGTLDSDTAIGVPDIGAKANAIRVCPADDVTDGTYIGDIKFGEGLPANSGVDIGDVDVTSIIPGVGATNLGKAEDAAHSSGDVGVAALTVRQDAAAALGGTDADYQPLITDANGRLHVLDANSAAIAASLAIVDDWDVVSGSAAATDGPQIMALYDSTKPTAVDDGDAVQILADGYGRLLQGVEPEWFNSVYDSSDATAEGETVKAATASKKIYITSYVISSDIEGWIKLQDEDSNALTGKFWLKAGGGVSWTAGPGCPLVLNVANKALEVIAEAAGDVSVTVTGYLAP